MNEPNLYSVVFVCTGNICRSPVAEGILRNTLSPLALSRSVISSAGVGAVAGLPASDNSILACAEEGIDIASHRSRPLTSYLMEESDLIITMETHHRDAVVRIAPHLAERTFVLGSYADPEADSRRVGVPDPIGGEIEVYRDAYRMIERLVLQAAPRIEAEILANTVGS